MTSAARPPEVPTISDTTDLRTGPEIHETLLAVLPLVGSWAGHGAGIRPADGVEFRYAQRIEFAHDGRPFLSYSSHTWLLDEDGAVIRPAYREAGFLRLAADSDDHLELVTASAAGIIAVFAGLAGDQRWEFVTAAVGFTPTAKAIAGERRLYALVDGRLGYVQELALHPDDYRPHLQGRLDRV